MVNIKIETVLINSFSVYLITEVLATKCHSVIRIQWLFALSRTHNLHN